MNEIRSNLTENVCDITTVFQDGQMQEELIEFIAERDEELLEQYMDSGYDNAKWLEAFKNLLHLAKSSLQQVVRH